MRIGVLIPCYQPDDKLITLIDKLVSRQLSIIVVDDGSTKNTEIFDNLGCTVLHHNVNKGKGAALKTGFSYMMENGFDAAVTADSDGQHSPEDICNIINEMQNHPDTLVMGMRDVAQMPPKSKTGNDLTRKLFKIMYGIDLQDTQTGLRGIPLSEKLLELGGDRYEYEMEMLIHSKTLFKSVIEVPIETIYIDNNKSSHFNPVKDGLKIYSVLFSNLPSFMLVSVTSFVVDYLLFNLLYYFILGSTTTSTIIARVVSSFTNFTLNKNFVFKNSGEKYNLFNYYKLAVFILICNMTLMALLVDVLGVPAFLAKIFVECGLYIVSYTTQNKWSKS